MSLRRCFMGNRGNRRATLLHGKKRLTLLHGEQGEGKGANCKVHKGQWSCSTDVVAWGTGGWKIDVPQEKKVLIGRYIENDHATPTLLHRELSKRREADVTLCGTGKRTHCCTGKKGANTIRCLSCLD